MTNERLREERWKEFDFQSLEPGAHIHLMGICGTAMASLAGLLQGRGYKVTGSDQNVYPPMSTQLEELGIKIKEGYHADNLSPRPDLVIVGNVISRSFPEAEALLESDIPFTSLPKAMGEFVIADNQSIVICGTHGKTTTTSIMANLAETCGLGPGFLIGGIPKNFSHSFQNPTGKLFIIEGDEYDTAFFNKVPKFFHYRPKHVVLTSVEFDHADIYSDMTEIMKAFEGLVDLIPEDGTLVANFDDENVRSLASKAKCRVISYGLRGEGDSCAEFIAESVPCELRELMTNFGSHQKAIATPKGTEVKIIKNDEDHAEYKVRLFGDYNVLNSMAAFLLVESLSWPIPLVKNGLLSFEGVKRRQEIIGRPKGITIIEDFAHHPTAVKMTIDAVQKNYQGKKVFSVFEPRSATTRRKVFQKQYVEAFSTAQELLIAKPYNQEKIPESDRFSSEEVVAELSSKNVQAKVMADTSEIVSVLSGTAKEGDVILIMSNGGFDGLYSKLISAIEAS